VVESRHAISGSWFWWSFPWSEWRRRRGRWRFEDIQWPSFDVFRGVALLKHERIGLSVFTTMYDGRECMFI
jgi:hypothetical protein